MDPSPLPWLRRFLRGVPPMSDTAFTGLLLLAVLLAGMVLGHALCLWTSLPTSPSLQQQLDAIDTRLRTLEQR